MKNKNIEIITLGCSKNTVDSERLMKQLKINNYSIVDSSDNADTILINTCGFIDAAKEESINTILEAVELKKKGEINKVIVAGCLSERYAEDLKKEIPEVDSIYGTEKYEEIINDFGGKVDYNLLGERELTTPKHFGYLKISEGCDNPCSFCAIPLMRGKNSSRSLEQLQKEAESLAQKGVKELIIIGQDTTDYGTDIYGKRRIAELLNNLSLINGIEWIRLLYAYPSHFPKDLIKVINDNPKICNYIDMPLQHISDKVLKSMRRGITKRTTLSLIEELKSNINNLTLRTTLITGYPAEGEEEFNELYEFVRNYEFSRLGVFNYSVEDSTPAFILGDPIPQEIKDERNSAIMELQKGISLNKNRSLIDTQVKVLIDDIEGTNYIGRSERDAPEVDSEIIIPAENKLLKIGNFYNTKIVNCSEYDLWGKII